MLLIISPLFSQNFTYFNKKLPVGNTPLPMSVIHTTEDGYFSVSPFEIGGIKVLFWSKFDFYGDKVKTGALDRDERIFLTDMNGDALLQHSNGNLYIAYTKYKTDDENDLDFALLSFDIGGESVFKAEYGTTKVETPSFLIEVENGHLLMGGIQSSEGTSRYYVVKVDKKGEMIWEKTYGTNVTEEPSLIFDKNNYLLFGSVNTPQNGKDLFLASINNGGQVNWSKEYGKKTDEVGQQIGLLQEKGYMLVGTIEENGNRKHQYIVVDNKGNVVTEKSYSTSGLGDFQTQLLPALEGKGFVGIANYTNENNFTQPLIMRINDEADVLWTISALTPTSEADVIAKDIEVGQNENGYVLTGYNDSKVPYGWVASFDVTGVHCSAFLCDSIAKITRVKNINIKPTIEISPNPTRTSFNINYQFPKEGKSEPIFKLYNLKGEIVKSISLDIDKESYLFDTTDLSSGMYFYTVTYRDIKVASDKLVVK